MRPLVPLKNLLATLKSISLTAQDSEAGAIKTLNGLISLLIIKKKNILTCDRSQPHAALSELGSGLKLFLEPF
jgi:hypothetical protein